MYSKALLIILQWFLIDHLYAMFLKESEKIKSEII